MMVGIGFVCQACEPKLKEPPKVYDNGLRCILIGDSITEIWLRERESFFQDNNLIGAGIGGQTSRQILARFEDDVVRRSPKCVSILCGINDIAQNEGYVSNEDIAANIKTMAKMARAAGIRVIICSVLPSTTIGWNPSVGNPAPLIRDLNTKLKTVAMENDCWYLDYHSVLSNDQGGLPGNLTTDGVHVTNACYEQMEEMFLAKLKEVLGDE